MMRRAFLAATPLAFAACRTANGRRLTRNNPPLRQRLVYLNRDDPGTLDPALTFMNKQVNITRCLFEGLVSNDPTTLTPCAALATHYKWSANGRAITFYLRGSPNPEGIVLRGGEKWPAAKAARWSDGTAITAHDFVYSWRRVIDPQTAAPFASYLYPVKNAEAISAGSLSPNELGVEARDDFTFRIELRSLTPYFLGLTAAGVLAAVPRQSVEAVRSGDSGSSSSRPGVVGGGAFWLGEWRAPHFLVLRKNTRYFDGSPPFLEGLRFVHRSH